MKILFKTLAGLVFLALVIGRAGERVDATIQAERGEYLVGEPIRIHIRLENKGDQPVNISSSALLAGEILIAENGSDFRLCDPIPAIESGQVVRRKSGFDHAHRTFGILSPGMVGHPLRTVLYCPDNIFNAKEPLNMYAMPRANRYKIRYRRKFNGEVFVNSNDVEVVIKEPSGEDAVVWKQIQGYEYARLVQWPETKIDEKSLISFGKVVQEHPESIYSPNLVMALGQNYLRNYGSKSEDAKKYLDLALKIGKEPWMIEEACLARIMTLNWREPEEGVRQRALALKALAVNPVLTTSS